MCHVLAKNVRAKLRQFALVSLHMHSSNYCSAASRAQIPLARLVIRLLGGRSVGGR